MSIGSYHLQTDDNTTGYMYPSRTKKAQKAHTQIFQYMQNSIDENALDNIISRLSPTDLLCPSSNGFNHLFDAYRLPYRICAESLPEVNQKSATIAGLLFKQARSLGQETLFSLLTALNHEHSTPFHEVLINGDQNSLEEFIQQLLASGHLWDPNQTEPVEVEICPDTHFMILVSPNVFQARNNQGFTPLDQAFLSNDPGKLEAYLKGARAALKAGILTADQYLEILTAPNINHLTPLQLAVQSNNGAILQVYLQELNSALDEGLLTEDEYLTTLTTPGFTSQELARASQNGSIRTLYTQALTAPDKNGMTLLHRAFATQNPQIVERYFKTMQKAYDNRIFDQAKYRSAILTCDPKGQTPLQLAFGSKKTEILFAYLQLIQYAFDAKIISKKEHQYILTAPDANQNTPLHLAFTSRKLDMIIAFLQIMSDAHNAGVLTDMNYGHQITAKNSSGSTPLHLACSTENAEIMETCFNLAQSAFDNQILSSNQYELLVTDSDGKGNTPLHLACASEDINMWDTWLQAMSQARHSSALSDQSYRGLLVAENTLGYTPLDRILISGNPQILRAYNVEIEKRLDQYDIHSLLMHADSKRNTPLHNSAAQGTFEGTDHFLGILEHYLSKSEFPIALRVWDKNGRPPAYPLAEDLLLINALLKDAKSKHPLVSQIQSPTDEKQSSRKRTRTETPLKEFTNSERHSQQRKR